MTETSMANGNMANGTAANRNMTNGTAANRSKTNGTAANRNTENGITANQNTSIGITAVGNKANGKPSRILAMDTATSSLTAALLQDGEVVGQKQTLSERNHSLYLVPTIETLLQETGWRPGDLDGIAVGVGPGSYTGVRIGVTVAKTMAWSLQLPIAAVSSLEALAHGAIRRETPGTVQWLVPLINARRGQVYTGLFIAEVDETVTWSRLQPDGIRMMDDWADELLMRAAHAVRRPDLILFLGETELFQAQTERFAARWNGRAEAAPARLNAVDVGRLADRYGRFAGGEAVHLLAPNYTQLAEAESKLLAKRRQEELGNGH